MANIKYIITFVMLWIVTMHLCIAKSKNDELDSVTYSSFLSVKPQDDPYFPDDQWLVNAIQEIAYYLRNHKFNEWDRRHIKNKPKSSSIGFYAAFPEPKLRSVHWQVQENCGQNFHKCISYLYSVIDTAPFTRSDDVSMTLSRNESISKDTAISDLNKDCKRSLKYAEKTGLPFDTPFDKFFWRTSASYYMCWYTMLGTPALSMIGESCDNFANCLDSKLRHRNYDPRSDDKLSFACAIHSFCPDPCCPVKRVRSIDECPNIKKNPCLIENNKTANISNRQCLFNRQENQNLEDIIANNWNVSCHCKEKGFEWKSKFGMCTDINECTNNQHNCDGKTQTCLNLPGSYQCICKWDYFYDPEIKKCVNRNIVLKPSRNESFSYFKIFDDFKGFLEFIGLWHTP